MDLTINTLRISLGHLNSHQTLVNHFLQGFLIFVCYLLALFFANIKTSMTDDFTHEKLGSFIFPPSGLFSYKPQLVVRLCRRFLIKSQ